MERNTQTTVKQLREGDRFYKVKDRNKKVLQMVPGKQVKTYFQTYNYFCKADTERHSQAINPNTQVIFLRHTNEQTNISTAGTAQVAQS